MAITVQSFLYRASTLLQDTKPQFMRWKERELITWLNDGQRAIAKYMPFAYSRIDVIKLAAGSRQSIASILAAHILPGDGSTPADIQGSLLLDIIRNMGADGITPGLPISVIKRDVQDGIDSAWHSADGGGVLDHFTFDPRTPKNFYAVPAVSAIVDTWAEISYIAHPAELEVPASDEATLYTTGAANANAVLTLDDNYLDDLLSYVCARAFMKDSEYGANMGLAQTYTQMFAQSLNAQIQLVTGQNPNISFLPFSPQPMTSAAK